MYGDMFVHVSTPAAVQPLRRSKSAAMLHRDDDPFDLHELQTLAALRARRHQKPVQHKDEVKRLLRATGKLQIKAEQQRSERRVRKVCARREPCTHAEQDLLC